MQFRGDNGKMRAALLLSGFLRSFDEHIFNDRLDTGIRRLKLWFATEVFDAPQEQQEALRDLLLEAFGDRILCMYFVPNRTPWGALAGSKSLCIKLQA